MSRLTLVFTACSVIIAGAHFGLTKGEPAQDQLESPLDDLEEPSERSALANGQASAYPVIVVRPRPPGPYPPNPGPYPPNPGPYPPNPGPMPWTIGSCYSCAGCPNVDNSTARPCPTYGQVVQAPRCVFYTEKYPKMKDPWVVRGCVSERGSCEEIRRTHNTNRKGLVQLLSCDECVGDLCNDRNGAGHLVPNLLIAAIAIIATPMLSKISSSKI